VSEHFLLGCRDISCCPIGNIPTRKSVGTFPIGVVGTFLVGCVGTSTGSVSGHFYRPVSINRWKRCQITVQKSTCDCPQNCQDLAHSVFESRELLDPEELCKLDLTITYINEVESVHKFVLEFDNVMNNETVSRGIIQWKVFKNEQKSEIALVSVEIAAKSMLRSVRDRRITLSGQLATLGKWTKKII
jgi:hypothetical protein